MVVYDPASNQYVQVPDPPRLRVPFLRQEIGAGDVIAAATHAMGLHSCTPCEQRQKWLNERLRLSPWGT